MKEVIRLEKSEEAVSPVIATILMVAITVVLAATVYILVSHYTSAGATTPLTASVAELSESGGTVVFSLSLSAPSNITNPSDISLKVVSGTDVTGTIPLTYTAGTTSSSAYWSGTVGSDTIYVTFTNPNGVATGWNAKGNYVASGATMNVYVSTSTLTFTSSSGAPSSSASLDSNYPISGLAISMSVTGYSGAVTATAP